MNERIRKVRKTLDLTQQEFGKRIGIKRNSVALIENGRNTSDQTIFAICREFNVNEEWLRTGNGTMFNPAPSAALDAMAEEYNLSHGDYILIEKFVNMKTEKRDVIVEYITQVASALATGNENPTTKTAPNLFDGIPKTPEELEKLFPPVDPEENKGTG